MKPVIRDPLNKESKETTPIIRLQYKGLPVVISKQLCKTFGCTRTNITNTLRYHSEEFVEGVDYFKIDGEEMINFKKESRKTYSESLLKRCGCSADEELFCVHTASLQGKIIPNEYYEGLKEFDELLSRKCNCVILFTQSGALKLSKHIGTDRAQFVYSMMALSYFKNYANGQEPILEIDLPKIGEPKKEEKTKKTVEIQINSADFSPREKVDRLIKLAELTTDENLRNDLIRRAAAII